MSRFSLNPFTTVARRGEVFVLAFWGACNGPALIEVSDPEHPLFRLLGNSTTDFDAFAAPFEDDFASLVSQEIIVPQGWSRSAAMERYRRMAKDSSTLHLVLLPAGTACNCDCIYCGQEHDGPGMSWESDGEPLLRQLHIRKLQTLHLEYFGGEPLLNQPFIHRFNTAIRMWARASGTKVTGSMTTNATLLTPELCGRLVREGVTHFQITVDGGEEDHNRQRPMRCGGNGYQQILANIRGITTLPEDFRIDLRMNFDRVSGEQDKVSRAFAALAEATGGDSRFFLRTRAAGDWGGGIDTSTLCSKFNAVQKNALFSRLALKYGFPLADLRTWEVGGQGCYAGRINSLVIEPGLRVKKCTVCQAPLNDVGQIDKAGLLHLNGNLSAWTGECGAAITKRCAQCPIFPVCLGIGCPLKSLDGAEPGGCILSLYHPREMVQLFYDSFKAHNH
ncbi:radical SAM protein [Geomonas agri]|uniref:radical SAM protein n=1 Tax=Geomonas agri TaxID=2873702 RepID=UPI001CD6EAC5|nr:radical SAM protein [Geomonas agri]